jgi:hypothetical protein
VRGECGRKGLNGFQVICLRGMAGVALWDIINNDVVRLRTGMVRKLEDRVDARVLRWFGHMVRMDDGRLAERVMESELLGSWPRGRPKFSWMDGLKLAIGRRDISVELARERAMDRCEWR